MAVEVGVDGNVTENLYSHEEDANSKNDSHYESTVPVAGYAFFVIKKYFLGKKMSNNTTTMKKSVVMYKTVIRSVLSLFLLIPY